MSVSSPSRRGAATVSGALLVVIGAACALLLASGTGASASGQVTSTGGAVPTPQYTGCAYRSRSSFVRRGSSRRPRVAMTFDDGPSQYTPKILDILEREHVPATFFVVGKNVAGREAVLQRMLADGNMIGNHSFTHVSLAKADAAAQAQIDDTQDAISAATGFTPCLLRPPYGRVTKRLLGALQDRRLTGTLWSVNPRDFTTPGTTTIVRRVLKGVKPGAIVLDHDGGGNRSQTVAALPRIIKALKARGYRFVTVTDLLGLRPTP